MKKFLFFGVLFSIILAFSLNVNSFDADLWARLIAGMGVVDGGQVLKQDIFSYTPVHEWIDHEWGAGVIFYLCLKLFGGYGLIVLQALLIFGIFFFVSKIVKMKSEHPYNILFYMFALVSVLPVLNNPVRCHLFSFLFFTIFIYILEKVRLGNKKLICILPFITLLWGNIHGGVVSGVGLLLIYALGEALNKKSFKEYIFAFLASSMMLFINPWGYKYVIFLIKANTMQRPYIVEWFGIFSHLYINKYLLFKTFMFSTVLAEIVLFIKQAKMSTIKLYDSIDKTKFILLAATLYLSIAHLKLIPLFTICACCFVYEDIMKLFKNVKLPKHTEKCVYSAIIVLVIFSFISKEYSLPVGFDKYPVKEIEFIKLNNLSGNLLTNFGYGSYAAYKLYPQNKIYMDGRYEEVYPDFMLPILKDFFLNIDPDKVLINYAPDVMIIEKKYPIYNKLMLSKDWMDIYSGKMFTVFVPKNKQNKKKRYIEPSGDMRYYKNNLFTTDINIKLLYNNKHE